MRRGLGWIGLLVVAWVATGCATVEILDLRVVRGRITDEGGRPVPDTPVTIAARTLVLDAMSMDYKDTKRRDHVARTDGQGEYRFEFRPGELGNNFTLFFYGAEGFDAVHYRKAEPIDITDRLKAQGELRLDEVLRTHPDWQEVQRRIAAVGSDSPRGQVLRTQGLPEKVETFTLEGQSGETWWYYRLGMSYRFVGPKLLGGYPLPAPPKTE